MFSLLKPSGDATDRFLRTQRGLDFTQPEVGSTARWDGDATPPRGFRFDRARVVLGTDRDTFDRAVEALRGWKQFDVGWVDLAPHDTPIEPGRIVGVRARVLGVWTRHACRIIYVLDDERGGVRRFGFGYGTLPGHAESGEERFLVEWDRGTDVVAYDVAAFVRPRHPLAVLMAPYAVRLADRFRRDSAAAMRRAVGGKGESLRRVAGDDAASTSASEPG